MSARIRTGATDITNTKKFTAGFLGFLFGGIVLLYWFLPMFIEIIEDRIIDKYFWNPKTESPRWNLDSILNPTPSLPPQEQLNNGELQYVRNQ